jgi:hypothetical protein
MKVIKPFCTGCNKEPNRLDDFNNWASEGYDSADDMCRQEEGTYNQTNGHFLCLECYISAGMPANHYAGPGSGWVAP